MHRDTAARILRVRSVAVTAVVAGALLLVSRAPAHADGVPYTDERSSGSLTLCDAGGHELRQGSVATHPLVHLVVGQTAAPQGYDTRRSTATLYGYQPRKGLASGQWSGELLTGASRFADPHHPAVVALSEDLSLANFVADFPPAWDGLVQLRVYLAAPGQQLQNQRYDSADLRISGGRWSLARGGGGQCHGVKAVPVAQILGVQATAIPSTSTGALTGAAQRSTGSGSAAAGPTGTGTNPAASERAHPPSGSRQLALPIAAGVVLLLLLGGGALLVHRRSEPSPA